MEWFHEKFSKKILRDIPGRIFVGISQTSDKFVNDSLKEFLKGIREEFLKKNLKESLQHLTKVGTLGNVGISGGVHERFSSKLLWEIFVRILRGIFEGNLEAISEKKFCENFLQT